MGSIFPYLPPLLLLASFGYFVFAIVTICLELRRRAQRREPDSSSPAVKFFLAGMAPATAGALLALIFYLPYYFTHGPTAFRFSHEFTTFENVKGWIPVCIVFLPLTAVSAVGSLIWLIICPFRTHLRRQIPAALLAILYSVLAFFATFYPLTYATV